MDKKGELFNIHTKYFMFQKWLEKIMLLCGLSQLLTKLFPNTKN